MSLRLRLTLLSTLLPGIALLGFGLVVYIITANNLYEGVDDLLDRRASEVRRYVRSNPLTLDDAPGQGDSSAHFAADDFSTSGVYVEVFSVRGDRVDRSQNLGTRDLPVPPPVTSTDSTEPESSHRTYRVAGQERVRVLHAPIVEDGQVTGWIAIGQSLHSVDVALSDLRNLMLIGGVGVLLIVAAAGYVLSGRGLRPLTAVAETARQISETGDFSRRIDIKREAGEVERLGRTFNDMIGTVQRTFDAQRSFLADSSHELRRPLTIVRGNIDLLANPNLDEEGRRESLEEMRIEAERMSSLISDLLLLSRIDVRQALQARPVDFARLVREEVRRRRAPDPHARLEVHVDEPLSVEGDEGRLRQMVSNLVDNAVRYTPPDGHVSVLAERRNGHVALEVTDTGIGISPADLEHVFDRFFRAPDAQLFSQEGAGLGLPIVKFVAEAHQGAVTAESVPGQGSRFTVTLPALD